MAEKKTTTTKKTTTKKTTTSTDCVSEKKTNTTKKKTETKKQKSFLQPLIDYIKKTNAKNWRKERVKCCRCGYEWNCIFPNIEGGEYKLQCNKCGARDSMVVHK